jgi:hypothetical protein
MLAAAAAAAAAGGGVTRKGQEINIMTSEVVKCMLSFYV